MQRLVYHLPIPQDVFWSFQVACRTSCALNWFGRYKIVVLDTYDLLQALLSPFAHIKPRVLTFHTLTMHFYRSTSLCNVRTCRRHSRVVGLVYTNLSALHLTKLYQEYRIQTSSAKRWSHRDPWPRASPSRTRAMRIQALQPRCSCGNSTQNATSHDVQDWTYGNGLIAVPISS